MLKLNAGRWQSVYWHSGFSEPAALVPMTGLRTDEPETKIWLFLAFELKEGFEGLKP